MIPSPKNKRLSKKTQNLPSYFPYQQSPVDRLTTEQVFSHSNIFSVLHIILRYYTIQIFTINFHPKHKSNATDKH